MQLLKIATRESKLALWQANHIAQQLKNYYPSLEVELIPLTSTGDQIQDQALAKIGGKGLFIKTLEAALLDGRAHVAVHSLKDVPADLDTEFELIAVSERESPYDALVSRNNLTLKALPMNAVVGTSSPRRAAQLKYYRPDLEIKLLRGNLQTRLNKLDRGEYDAILLACAGLQRLGLEARITEKLSEDVLLPSVGQGVLAIEALKNQPQLKNLFAPLNDLCSQACIEAERAMVKALDGTCHSPIGAFATFEASKNQLHLTGRVLDNEGKHRLETYQCGPVEFPNQLGLKAAEDLLQQGAKSLL